MIFDLNFFLIVAFFVAFYLLACAAMNLHHNFSLNVKPKLHRGRVSFQRYFKALISAPRFVFIVLALLCFVLLSRYWDQKFSPQKKSPHYFRGVNTFWGHLRSEEKCREIVCSRFSKDCYAIIDMDQGRDIAIRYLYSEKLGTGGYFTRSLVKTVDGKEMIIKDNVVSAYVRGMLLGSFLTGSIIDTQQEGTQSILMVGLGGGAMNNFYSTLEHQPYVTIIDIDPTIYYVARRWYDSKPTKFQEYFIEDAITFVQNRSTIITNSPNTKYDLLYDVILIDCSASEPVDGLVAPIIEFMDLEILKDVKNVLKPNGTAVINVVSLNIDLGPKILIKPYEIYKQIFNNCFFLKASLNFVMVCTDQDVKVESYSELEVLVQSLPKNIKEKLVRDILFQPIININASKES